MKLKNKTELRKEIRDSVGNTGSLRDITIFKDGTWDLHSCSTIYPDGITTGLMLLGTPMYHGQNINDAISASFREIENTDYEEACRKGINF